MDAKFKEAINGIMDDIKSELNYVENPRLHFADFKIRLITLEKIADMCDILERIANSLEKLAMPLSSCEDKGARVRKEKRK